MKFDMLFMSVIAANYTSSLLFSDLFFPTLSLSFVKLDNLGH
jgi:hypothetical protein